MMIRGLKFGMACQKQLRRRRSKNCLLNRQSSITFEDRGIHFIDPEDGEFQETIKNARKKLEVFFGSGHALQDGEKKACKNVAGN